LATFALVSGVLGVTVVPFLGGLVAAGVGAVALTLIRRQPAVWGGGGVAMTGFGLGIALGVVPTVAFFAAELVVGHHRWAIAPLVLSATYGVGVIALAARTSRAAAAVSALGAVGGAITLALAVLLALGASILVVQGIRALVRYTFSSVKCSVTHGGGTGKHCTRPAR
jgi:hypothetical protein